VDATSVRAEFERHLADHGLALAQLGAKQAVETMVAFYAAERVEGAHIDEDGDMLLFQWGTYDWGDGPSFQYDITRQLIVQDDDDDDAIWQLSLTLHYEPGEDAQALGSGDQWCDSPDHLDEFLHFIEDAPSTRFARRTSPRRVQLEFEPTD